MVLIVVTQFLTMRATWSSLSPNFDKKKKKKMETHANMRKESTDFKNIFLFCTRFFQQNLRGIFCSHIIWKRRISIFDFSNTILFWGCTGKGCNTSNTLIDIYVILTYISIYTKCIHGVNLSNSKKETKKKKG